MLSCNYRINDFYSANIDVILVYKQLLVVKFVEDLVDDESAPRVDANRNAPLPSSSGFAQAPGQP
jgi:hypothetical protein